MKKLVFMALLAVVAVGCATTDYPVIFDSYGPNGDTVALRQYDWSYLKPSGQVATIWPDGSDELFSLVTQDWKGDQWIATYENYDPTATVMFRDDTYCDPIFADYPGYPPKCQIALAWNPDLPTAYPHGDQGAGYNNVDDVFDYIYNPICLGSRSLSLLVSYTSRIGECGSGLWADKQNLALEFGQLDKTMFRNQSVYYVPFDSSIAQFSITGEDGAQTVMPIYGRFNTYVDEKLRMMVPMTPNMKYQMRWLNSWVVNHGHFVDVTLTYGSLNANFKLKVTTVKGAMERL